MKRSIPFIALLFFFLMVYVNYLSGTGQINNISAGGVSGKYPTLFTPAGFTFSIWGLIYLLGLVFIFRIIWMSFRNDNDRGVSTISIFYILSCLINISWIYTWHYDLIWLSELIMILLLIVLVLLYQEVASRSYPSAWSYLSTVTPVSIYLGWICIAMVANTAVWLTSLGWDGSPLSPGFWASLMLIVAALINLLILIRKRDVFFALVYLWAAYGIIMARSGNMLEADIWISGAALTGMILVFIGILFARFVKIEKT